MKGTATVKYCVCVCVHIQCFTPIYRKATINEYWYTVAGKAAGIVGGVAAVRGYNMGCYIVMNIRRVRHSSALALL
jgi:hypothetical protein